NCAAGSSPDPRQDARADVTTWLYPFMKSMQSIPIIYLRNESIKAIMNIEGQKQASRKTNKRKSGTRCLTDSRVSLPLPRLPPPQFLQLRPHRRMILKRSRHRENSRSP